MAKRKEDKRDKVGELNNTVQVPAQGEEPVDQGIDQGGVEEEEVRLFCPKCGERMYLASDRGAYQSWYCPTRWFGHGYERFMGFLQDEGYGEVEDWDNDDWD